MRIIAGSAGSLPLKTVPGMDTRPTTDRIKETLFNMLHSRLPQASFLDLFSGSGGIGLEAISRGAKEAVFVEQNRKACDCIRENIRFTGFEPESTLFCMDVFTALTRLEQEGHDPFDVIFMDPPYDKFLEKRVLEHLADSHLVSEDTLLVVEASLQTDFSYLEKLGFSVIKYKRYKTNMHVFLERGTQILEEV